MASLNTFITKYISNSSLVPSTKLDRTIKAIINNTIVERDSYSSIASIKIEYLNILRIIYFIKRLEYKDPYKAKQLKSKFYPLTFNYRIFILTYNYRRNSPYL